MKISKVLTVCFVLCCLFTSNVFGNGTCSSGLLDILSPNGGTYFQGDPICYEVSVQIPDDPAFCTYENFEVYFFAPNNPPNAPDACDADNGVLIISEETFGPGDSVMVDCGNPALNYVVSLADVVNGNELKAQICTKFTLDGNPDSDSKTITNFVEVNPCIDITKEACEFSKVGDDVIYTITIENCGDVDLEILSLEDSLLPLDPFICGPILPVGAVCVFEVPYLVQPGDLDPLINEVTVRALPVFYDGVIIVGQEVSDTAIAAVDLLEPQLEVNIQCVTNDIPVPGGPETIVPVPNGFATFEVCVRNTGDVALDIQQSDCFQFGPLPLPPRLEPGQEECMEVLVPVDGGFCGGGGEAWLDCCVTATIPPEYCELPNVIVACGDAFCEVPPVNPCFTATKDCVNDPVCGGDPALYEITITNCGDIELLFEVEDPPAGLSDYIGPLPPGVSESIPVAIPTSCPSDTVENEAFVTAYCITGDVVGQQIVTATCEVACPDLEVQKICLDEPVTCNDELADFEVIITNTGNVPLDLTIEDPDAIAPIPGGSILPGESISRIVQVPSECGSGSVGNVVTVIGVYDGCAEVVRTASADCPVEPCCDAEGCTPGFWKNHPDCWCDAYTEATLVSEVWDRLLSPPYDTIDDGDRKSDFDQDTLADALRYRGGRGLAGSVRNMLRHATAALLNACSGDVSYPISDQAVIDLVNFGLDTEDIAVIQDVHTLLAGWNEDSPCPIDAHCRVIDDEVNGY